MELLYNKLVEIFENDSSCTVTGKITDMPKEQPDVMKENVRAALYFYRTKRLCYFIDVENLEVYALTVEAVQEAPPPESEGAWYGVYVSVLGPERAKALTKYDLMWI